MKKVLMTVLALVALFTVSNAKGVELSIQGGKAFSNTNEVTLSLLDTPTLADFQNGWTLGVTGAIRLSRNFLLEGEFFYYWKPVSRLYIGEVSIINNSPFYLYNITDSTNSSAFNLNALLVYEFKLKVKKLIPYLAVGTGLMNTRVGFSENSDGKQSHDNESDMNINMSLGGGIKYLLGKASGIRFDCRYILVFSGATKTHVNIKKNYNIIRFTAGYFITI
jgi:opacity protein-like surface antigen